MDKDSINSFFNLCDSWKDMQNMSEKGLGAKIFFISKRIIVERQKDNERLRV